MSISVAFYERFLGREAYLPAPTFALISQDSGTRLVLMANEIVDPKSLSIGGTELAFGRYSDEEVDNLHRTWAEWGITIAQAPARNGFSYSFLAIDPDGHRLRGYHYRGFTGDR